MFSGHRFRSYIEPYATDLKTNRQERETQRQHKSRCSRSDYSQICTRPEVLGSSESLGSFEGLMFRRYFVHESSCFESLGSYCPCSPGGRGRGRQRPRGPRVDIEPPRHTLAFGVLLSASPWDYLYEASMGFCGWFQRPLHRIST